MLKINLTNRKHQLLFAYLLIFGGCLLAVALAIFIPKGAAMPEIFLGQPAPGVCETGAILKPTCNQSCSSAVPCVSGLNCISVSGSSLCRKPQCPGSTNCVCPSPSLRPSPSPSSRPSPSPSRSPSPRPSSTPAISSFDLQVNPATAYINQPITIKYTWHPGPNAAAVDWTLRPVPSEISGAKYGLWYLNDIKTETITISLDYAVSLNVTLEWNERDKNGYYIYNGSVSKPLRVIP